VDPDGDLDPASLRLVAKAEHGRVTLDRALGSFRYVPARGVQDTDDVFTYRVSDDQGAADSAVVTVHIGTLAQLEVLPGATHPGGGLLVRGSGCGHEVAVVVRVDGEVAGRGVTSRTGTFRVEVEAPAAVGRHTVEAFCGSRRLVNTLDVVGVGPIGAGSGGAAAGAAVVVGGLLFFWLLSGIVLAPRGTVTGTPRPASA
jgi:hypothetical protein